jgi:hypothetical protein
MPTPEDLAKLSSVVEQINERTGHAGRMTLGEGAPQQKPSVGRVVHYVAFGTPGGEFPAGVCRAAIITEINDAVIADGAQFPFDGAGRVGLMVANPTGIFLNRGIAYDPNKAPGTWHWPERV